MLGETRFVRVPLTVFEPRAELSFTSRAKYRGLGSEDVSIRRRLLDGSGEVLRSLSSEGDAGSDEGPLLDCLFEACGAEIPVFFMLGKEVLDFVVAAALLAARADIGISIAPAESNLEISDVKTDEGSPHLPRLRHDVDFLVTPLLLNAATPTFRQPFHSLATVPVSAISY